MFVRTQDYSLWIVTCLSQCPLGDRWHSSETENSQQLLENAGGMRWEPSLMWHTEERRILEKTWRTVWLHPHEFCCDNSAYKFRGNRRKDKHHSVIFKQKQTNAIWRHQHILRGKKKSLKLQISHETGDSSINEEYLLMSQFNNIF